MMMLSKLIDGTLIVCWMSVRSLRNFRHSYCPVAIALLLSIRQSLESATFPWGMKRPGRLLEEENWNPGKKPAPSSHLCRLHCRPRVRGPSSTSTTRSPLAVWPSLPHQIEEVWRRRNEKGSTRMYLTHTLVLTELLDRTFTIIKWLLSTMHHPIGDSRSKTSLHWSKEQNIGQNTAKVLCKAVVSPIKCYIGECYVKCNIFRFLRYEKCNILKNVMFNVTFCNLTFYRRDHWCY